VGTEKAAISASSIFSPAAIVKPREDGEDNVDDD
jgi:hypothetical protein